MRINAKQIKKSMSIIAVSIMATMLFGGNTVFAESGFFSSSGCTGCHSLPVTATCNGCHAHGTHPSSAKNAINITGTTNKTSYVPGETVSVTIAGGYRSGWVRAVLYNQNSVELARSTGNASGTGSSTTLPAVLTATAPAAAGTYTWKVAWYGNQDDVSGAAFGSGWTPDPSNPEHGYQIVNTNTFTVVSTSPPVDTSIPVVTAFTIPATATSLTVPISIFTVSDNVLATGYLLTESSTAPTAAAAGWSSAAPSSYTFTSAGTKVLYAWAKDGSGNVSRSASATVNITLPSTVLKLTVSTLPDGSYTNNATLNVSGTVSDSGGVMSVTVNGQNATLLPDGSFSAAISLVSGANTITVLATSSSGVQSTNTRTINFDPVAPVLTVNTPADNSTALQSYLTVSGSVSESSRVAISVNNGSPQSAAISGNTFSGTVNLSSGTNTIVVNATDLAGNSSSVKRSVNYTAQFTLAVTNPSQDITTRRPSLILVGSVFNSTTQLKVTISMDGKTYTPTIRDGVFRQQLNFTAAKTYAITVTATDNSGASISVTRNVIYRPAKGRKGDDDRDEENERD